MFYTNHLARLLYGQPMEPMNMLAQNDFDPNGIVAKMLAAQRAAEAARQMQQAPPSAGQPVPPPQPGMESATDVLRRRMREAGLE
jgi:hypothetical protein